MYCVISVLNLISSKIFIGCAVAQAVSGWLPNPAARIRVRAEHVRFVVDTIALGQGFL
jgi:hypothetical protein